MTINEKEKALIVGVLGNRRTSEELNTLLDSNIDLLTCNEAQEELMHGINKIRERIQEAINTGVELTDRLVDFLIKCKKTDRIGYYDLGELLWLGGLKPNIFAEILQLGPEVLKWIHREEGVSKDRKLNRKLIFANDIEKVKKHLAEIKAEFESNARTTLVA